MSNKPTPEQMIGHMHAAREHIYRIQSLLGCANAELNRRAVKHDQSKFYSPECEGYASVFPRFETTPYGTPERDALCQEIKGVIEHHQSTNDHHPEAQADGIYGMNLIQVLELVSDWKSALDKNGPKDLAPSLEYSIRKYGITGPLAAILRNTVPLLNKWAEESYGYNKENKI